MSSKKGIDRIVWTLSVLGSLVFLNILSLRYFGRLDLTRDQQFTLSEATATTLEELKDPITVRAYFTKDLPPPFSTNARYVRDLLEEYHTNSNGNLRFEFVDPVSEETQADKDKKKEVKQDIFGRAVREQTSVERDMESLGIPPVQVQVNQDDKVEVKRAYMGLAVNYGDKTEIIPMVQSTEGLEYDLTTLIRKLTREKTPKVALLGGHAGPEAAELSQARGLLTQLYDVVDLDLSQQPEIPEDVDAILVVGPTTPLSETEQKALDAFIAKGKSVAFLLDAVKPDFQKLEAGTAEHGLGKMLQTYGVEIEPGLVLDAESATINVAQQRGFMRIMQPVKYPFIPQPKGLDPDHPLTRGLSQVVFPFMSPLKLTADGKDGAKGEVLVRSSAKSWVQPAPFDLNPMQEWSLDQSKAAPRDLVIALSGHIKSFFGGGDADAADPTKAEGESEGDKAADGTTGRVLVVGGSSFVTNQFLAPGNQALLLNLLDWMVLDDALLAMRTRGLSAAPLEEVPDQTRSLLRYANVIGLPLALIAFGILRWRMRERRRGLVHV